MLQLAEGLRFVATSALVLERCHHADSPARTCCYSMFTEQANAIHGIPHERVRVRHLLHRGNAAQVLYMNNIEGTLSA